MMNKKIVILFLFLLAYGFPALTAQVLHAGIAAAGGEATGAAGSASYTVGQLVYTTATGTSGSVAQGVQQPFEINVISGIDDIYNIELFTAYPNPASTHLILKIENTELKNFSYRLFDLKGSMLRTESIKVYETIINMIPLQPAAYFLRVFAENKEIITFKIVKR